MSGELVEQIEDIREKLHRTQAQIQHTFQEENTVADALANEIIYSQISTDYHDFYELPVAVRKYINMDRTQIPNLMIQTKKINIQT